MQQDQEHFDHILGYSQLEDIDYFGDIFVQVCNERALILDPDILGFAEFPLAILRGKSARANYDWNLFKEPIKLTKQLNDLEIVSLFNLELALHELCFACENIESSALITWGGGTPTRFYLNSFYHYTSSMFLIDKSTQKQKKYSMGGTVIKVLNPIGLNYLLDSINNILSKGFNNNITFGEIILKLRHSYLVHGSFSPHNTEYIIEESRIREKGQQEKFASYVWDLYYQIHILRLRILSLSKANNFDVGKTITDYIASILEKKRR